MKYFYRFDGNLLSINHAKITLEEYQFWTSSKNLIKVKLCWCHVSNPNGSFVPAETILAPLYDVEDLFL